MAAPCSICTHPAVEAINRELIRGTAMSVLARRYEVGDDSVRRHRDRHLTRALGKAVEAKRLDITAERLVDWGGSLQLKTLKLLARAEELDDLGNARGLIREARENLVLLGRLGGVLEGPTATITVDARRQVAVLGNLTEAELRRLAACAETVDADDAFELGPVTASETASARPALSGEASAAGGGACA